MEVPHEKQGVSGPHQALQPRAPMLRRGGIPLTSGSDYVWKRGGVEGDRDAAFKGLTHKLTCFKLQHRSSRSTSAWVIWGGIKLRGRITLGGEPEGQGSMGTLSGEGSAGGCRCSFVYFVVLSFHLASLEQEGTKPVTLHYPGKHHSFLRSHPIQPDHLGQSLLPVCSRSSKQASAGLSLHHSYYQVVPGPA